MEFRPAREPLENPPALTWRCGAPGIALNHLDAEQSGVPGGLSGAHLALDWPRENHRAKNRAEPSQKPSPTEPN